MNTNTNKPKAHKRRTKHKVRAKYLPRTKNRVRSNERCEIVTLQLAEHGKHIKAIPTSFGKYAFLLKDLKKLGYKLVVCTPRDRSFYARKDYPSINVGDVTASAAPVVAAAAPVVASAVCSSTSDGNSC